MTPAQRDRAQYLLDEIVWLALFPASDSTKAFQHIKACRAELVVLLEQQLAPDTHAAALRVLDRIIGAALFPGDRGEGIDVGELLRVATLRGAFEDELDR